MRVITKISNGLLMLALLLSQVSCTKEKAEALKTTAKAFQAQANTALDKLENLLIADVAFTPEKKEESIAGIVAALKTTFFGEEGIQKLVKGAKLRELDTNDYSEKIAKIRETYTEFAGMYENLPRGSYFAGSAVERSEKLAVKLTVQMLALAKYVRDNPFKLNARIQEVRRKRDEAVKEADSAVLNLKLRAIADEILNIQYETEAANNAAVTECTKGAAIGLEVAKLIRNYKKLSVTDILQTMKEVLPAICQLTGQNTDALFGKLSNIQLAINRDPVWKDIATQIEAEINKKPAPGLKL